jgi:MFS transporter, DHA1 family, multidrug resistance protein
MVAMGSIASITLISPVISLYLDRRGLPPAHVGAIIGAMSLTLVITEVLALGVSSVIGRRRSVILGLVASAAMFAWFPLAGSLAALYAARLALGAVRGVLWPVMFAEVAEIGPPDQRPALFALFWLYFGVGMLLGPALGGALGERISLTAPFFAAAITSLLTVPGAVVVRPIRDGHRNPMTSYAALLQALPLVTRAWTLTICNTIIFGVYMTFLPLHAAAKGLNAGQIGLIFTAGGVAFIVGQALLSRVAGRIPADRLLLPAFLVRGLGVALVPLMSSFPALAVTNFATSVIGAVVPPAISVRLTTRTPREHMVAAMGGFNAAADVGFFVGPVLGGIVAGFGLEWAFVMTVPVILLALVLLLTERG